MFSMIARADAGGLASQTLEIARHCGPTRVLIIDLGQRGRGEFVPARFDGLGEVHVTTSPPPLHELRWLCKGIEAVYTAEANYNDDLPVVAARYGTRHVVHANPELWRAAHGGPTTELVVPTEWERERLGVTKVMPMPVDRARLPFTQRDTVRRFYFPAAPAFHDRHGEHMLIEAFRRVRRRDVTLLVGPKPRARSRRLDGGVLVETVPPRADYWNYPDADALVLPRRYGGLSLPLQEAASLGMPIITLDLAPYAEHLTPELLVEAVDPRPVEMKGGAFPVWTCRPRALADIIEALVDDPALAARASLQASAFAETLAWDHWQSPWRALLGAA